MTKAVFNSDGIPLGFYNEEIHGENIPADAIDISDEQWVDLLAGCGSRVWKNGEVVDIDPTFNAPTIADYENAIQNLVDSTAREKQFRDGVTLASYTASTKPNWAAEAQAFVAWRDNVWFYAYGELAKVQAGQRQQPSVEEFLAEIPPIEWPQA
ncbi:hypothetical protein AGRO_3656 [Agrobacterium sp. ATCC 31749]|uniref:hypothetical protein n=1 Tax=unclassified Agrobacterium TaxID=2632611 RepID=UPI00020DB61A|nr:MULTISPECIES: hypothetical protein [unclassified Agrobacterium]EGL63587.1 hypothetical protein AGRO_3656 [Agrobacterium sp. ATCC 31749]